MAEFSTLTITEKGQALITKIMTDGGTLEFTKIATSETVYSAAALESLTALTGIKQTAEIGHREKINRTQIKLCAAVENSLLDAGYTINTIGLYAVDPDDGEILYAVCRAIVPGYIPAYNGMSVSGASFEFTVGVGNASHVNLQVDPAVVATFADVERHENKQPSSEGGVHGMRYNERMGFEVNTENGWVELQRVYKTYGVSIDLTNSNPETSVTYTDDAVGMVAGSSDWDNTVLFKRIRPCVFKDGAVVGYLQPNDFTKYVDGTAADITSGDEGDVMIEFPKLGYKITTSGDTLTVQVTNHPCLDGFSYLAHTRENPGDRKYFYVGAYLGCVLDAKLRSLSNVDVTSYNDISTFRSTAQANGSGYEQVAFYQLTLLQCLYLIKYKDLDSQNAVGIGLVSSAHKKTGGTETRGMDYGSGNTAHVKLMGIEDFWGNYKWWVDGLRTDGNGYIKIATNGFGNSGNYVRKISVGATYQSGCMSKPQGTNELGFIPKEMNGSETTYFSCSCGIYGGEPCAARIGGTKNDGFKAGVFRLGISTTMAYSEENTAARLMYL